MSRLYRVSHTTRYRYTEAVMLCHNQARMTPANDRGQQCRRSVFSVDPPPADMSEYTDYFGNRVTYFDVESPHDSLSVQVVSEVQTADALSQTDFDGSRAWETVCADLASDSDEVVEAREFQLTSPLVPVGADVASLVDAAFTPGRPVVEALAALTHEIYTQLEYDPVATTVSTPLSSVLRRQRGVCQDFAHVAIACLRRVGLAGAYVSGYLETLPPPGQEKLVGSDASHAWFSAFVPGMGWLDFDPTNDAMPDDRYVVVARGRDYSDVPPLKGVVFGGGSMRLHVGVDVTEMDVVKER